MQDIHPASTKLTLRRDAAELVRLETQQRVGDSHTETQSLPSSAVSNVGTERVDVQPEKHSEFAAPNPTLIASRMSPAGRKREADSGEEHLQKRSGRSSELRPKSSEPKTHRPPHDNRINNRDWVRSLVPWAALSAFQLLENHCNSYRQMQPTEAARARLKYPSEQPT